MSPTTSCLFPFSDGEYDSGHSGFDSIRRSSWLPCEIDLPRIYPLRQTDLLPQNNGTIWPSPIGLAASFNPDLLKQAAATISDEAEGLGINQLFAPDLDLGRELRWGRVEEGYGEDPFL